MNQTLDFQAESVLMAGEFFGSKNTYAPPNTSSDWFWLADALSISVNSGLFSDWVNFVCDAHTNHTNNRQPQKRADGTPYYRHPIKVSMLAANHLKQSPISPFIDWLPFVLALIGHDLFEDTKITKRDVIHVLGGGLGVRTADFITGVTKPPKQDSDRKDGGFKYTYNIYRHYATSVQEVRLIKGFDRIHNITDMKHQPLLWRKRYLDDTLLLLGFLHPSFGVRELLEQAFWEAAGLYYQDAFAQGE